MGLVYLEKRSFYMTSHKTYFMVLPKLWVKTYYPSLPKRDTVLVAVGKVVVIMPKNIPQDKILKIKKLLEEL